VTANLQEYTADLGSYHGYWQQNLYELNDKFGTENDLKALSDALHARDMVRIILRSMSYYFH
jgi:alpha-amylase